MTNCFDTYPPFKRGSTLSWPAVWRDSLGATVDLTDSTIEMQLRKNSGALIDTLTITLLDQVTNRGAFTISADDTSEWPIGLAKFDIKRTVDNVVVYSSTATINIEEQVTA